MHLFYFPSIQFYRQLQFYFHFFDSSLGFFIYSESLALDLEKALVYLDQWGTK